LSKESGEIIGAKYTADRDKTELFDGYGTILSGLRRKYSDYNVDLVDQTHNGDSLLIKMSAPYSSGALLAFEKGDTELVTCRSSSCRMVVLMREMKNVLIILRSFLPRGDMACCK